MNYYNVVKRAAAHVPRIRLARAIEILLWIAALAVLAENVVLLRQNGHLHDAVAPQIAAGAQLQSLAGLALDGHVESMSFTPMASRLLEPRRIRGFLKTFWGDGSVKLYGHVSTASSFLFMGSKKVWSAPVAASQRNRRFST